MKKYLFLIIISCLVLILEIYRRKFNMSYKIIRDNLIALYYIGFKPLKNKRKKNDFIKYGIEHLLYTNKIKLNKFGEIYTKPVLYISNHCSYLDSLILKYTMPNILTVCKADAKDDVGFMSSFLNSILDNWGVIFYDRGNKESGSNVKKLLYQNIVNKGNSVLIYPEGKSVINSPPEKFYKGSIELAYYNNIPIQPITIKYLTDISWGCNTKYTSSSNKHNSDIIENIKFANKFKENPVNITFHPVLTSKQFNNSDNMVDYIKTIITDEWLNQKHTFNSFYKEKSY